MSTPMMKCGHAANAKSNGKPSCVICVGIHTGAMEVDPAPTQLVERVAECAYCSKQAPSSLDLPFFEHRPERADDKYYCGCRGWE